MKKRYKGYIAFAATGLLLIAAAGLFILWSSWRAAGNTPPSPTVTPSETDSAGSLDDDGFPVVDWDYWQNVNPDVIGWITIPGTTVNSPILQAHADAPDYYLNHDIYRNYNPNGAIFLDAECENLGLSSRNAVILGHHIGSDYEAAPFGIIAEYKDTAFASGHATILLQTPNAKSVYEVRFAQIVNGLEPNKRTSFTSDEDFRIWYAESKEDAAMVLDDDAEPLQTLSLVTCSYNIWVENERTLLVASEKYSESQKYTENAVDGFRSDSR